MSDSIRPIWAIVRRELYSYFATPVAYVYMVVFLFLMGVFTYYLGSLYERNQADLLPFFTFHPWLYLALLPAISMRLWSEENRSGTLELLMTLPISTWQAVCGKFIAAWLFTGLLLGLTIPTWLTVNYLGEPDNWVVFTSYIGSFWLAGAYLAIGACISALSKNQVVAFIITVVVCFLFIMSGFPLVLNFFSGWAPQAIVDVIASFSFITHFEFLKKGVIDLRDVIFFLSLIGLWLYANVLVIDLRK